MATRFRTALVIGLLLAGSTAGAATFNFESYLSGANEVLPVATPATGFGAFVYDDVANTLSVNVSWSGLIGTTTAAHIHAAPVGTNGAVQFGFVGFPVGVTAGNYNALWSGLTPAQVSDLFAEGLYVNIHTTFHPGGEIRDQLREAAIPELPASALAAIPGLLALVWRKRR